MLLSEFGSIGDLATKKMLNKAHAKYPLAASDIEALARYIKDQEESDIAQLQKHQDVEDRLIDKIGQTEHELEKKISQVQADVVQLAGSNPVAEGSEEYILIKDGDNVPYRIPSSLKQEFINAWKKQYSTRYGSEPFYQYQRAFRDQFSQYRTNRKEQGVAEGTDIVPATNPKDTVSLDIPLLIRLLEYAREDAKTDIDLHNVAERLINLSGGGETLNMSNYAAIVPGKSE